MIQSLITSYPCTFWLVLGLFLSFLELFMPGLVVIFFGVGALVTGILALCIPPLTANWPAMLSLFILFSAVSLAIFRRKFVGNKSTATVTTSVDIDEPCIGHLALTLTEVNGEGGTIEFNGVNWNALSDTSIASGTRVRIVKRDGLTLFVQKAN